MMVMRADHGMTEMYPEPENKTDVRAVDKLVKVFRKGGGEEWILTLCLLDYSDKDRLARWWRTF